MIQSMGLSKTCRHFGAAVIIGAGVSGCTTTPKGSSTPRSANAINLKLFSNHLGESATITSLDDPDVDRICRDRIDGTVKSIDPNLVGKLVRIEGKLEEKGYQSPTFRIVSCFRSERTNEILREAGGGQARNSTHTKGEAMDIQVTARYGGRTVTVPVQDVWDAACEVRKEDGYGGLGRYNADGFVHVDSRSNISTWGGECTYTN